MKLEESGALRILTPEVGYKIYSVKTNSYHTKIYLGKFDSVDNYREMVDEDYVDIDVVTKVKELEAVNNEQDEVINITMMATDEINTEYNALTDNILLAIDELYNMIETLLGGDGGE